MSRYTVSELAFDVPFNFRDESVNILTAQGAGFAGTSIVLTRAIDDADDLDSYVTGQLHHYGEGFKQFTFLGGYRLAKPAGSFRTIEYRWMADRGWLHQWQLFLQLPGRILVWTFTAPNQMTKTHREFVERFADSVQIG